eukprot:3423211-Pyramimonas_sp.AAC.1
MATVLCRASPSPLVCCSASHCVATSCCGAMLKYLGLSLVVRSRVIAALGSGLRRRWNASSSALRAQQFCRRD